jgi:hypothetical protein
MRLAVFLPAIALLTAACAVEDDLEADPVPALVDTATLDAAFALIEAEQLEQYVISIDGIEVFEEPDASTDLAAETDPSAVTCWDGCCFWDNPGGWGTRVCCRNSDGPATCTY